MSRDKKLCDLGKLDNCEFTKNKVLSQYEQDIREPEATTNEGNLYKILEIFRKGKEDIFKFVCDCINNFNIDTIKDKKLDCLAHALGLNRSKCNDETVSDDCLRIMIKNRAFEISNPFPTFKELKEHIEKVFPSAGDYDICVKDNNIDIFMKRELTDSEKKCLQGFLDTFPINCSYNVTLYPKDLKKCLYLQYDINEATQGQLNEALINCDPKTISKIYKKDCNYN